MQPISVFSFKSRHLIRMKTTPWDSISNKSTVLLHQSFSSTTQKLSPASRGSDTTTHPSQSGAHFPCWVAACGQSPTPAHQPQCWKGQQPCNVKVKSQPQANPHSPVFGVWHSHVACHVAHLEGNCLPVSVDGERKLRHRVSRGTAQARRFGGRRLPPNLWHGGAFLHIGGCFSHVFHYGKEKKKKKTINKWIFRSCIPMWGLWPGVNPQSCPLFLLTQHPSMGSCANTEDEDVPAAKVSMVLWVKWGKRPEQAR